MMVETNDTAVLSAFTAEQLLLEVVKRVSETVAGYENCYKAAAEINRVGYFSPLSGSELHPWHLSRWQNEDYHPLYIKLQALARSVDKLHKEVVDT